MSTASYFPESVPTTARQQRELLSGSILDSTDFEQTYDDYPSKKHQNSRFLQVSFYEEIEHQLDLYSVDLPDRLFAQAMTKLESATPKYAIIRYAEALNWPTVFAELRSLAAAESFEFPQSEFYVVEFRSKLKEKFNYNRLFSLDKHSHREATAAGGLLKYWFGVPDAERRNLATCKSTHMAIRSWASTVRC